MICDPRHATVL